jgi:hypothetical protein
MQNIQARTEQAILDIGLADQGNIIQHMCLTLPSIASFVLVEY